MRDGRRGEFFRGCARAMDEQEAYDDVEGRLAPAVDEVRVSATGKQDPRQPGRTEQGGMVERGGAKGGQGLVPGCRVHD